MKTQRAVTLIAGLVVSANTVQTLAQSASVILTTSSSSVRAGDSFTVTATGTGAMGVFAYNLLVDASEGADLIGSVSNLLDNPTGSTSIFTAPSGMGLGAGTGYGVDRRDASVGIIFTPIPIDNIPFFTFTVETRPDAEGTITYGSARGSGSKGALSYPDPTIFPPIVTGTDYHDIDFGSVQVSVVPTPAAALCLVLVIPTRRRRA